MVSMRFSQLLCSALVKRYVLGCGNSCIAGLGQMLSHLGLMVVQEARIGHDNEWDVYLPGVKDGASTYARKTRTV